MADEAKRQSYVQRVAMGTQGNNIVVAKIHFGEDGFGTQQINMSVPIDPTANADQMLKKAAGLVWEPKGNPNNGGFFQAEQKRAITEEELATATRSGNRSISVIIYENEEESLLGGDLVISRPVTAENPLK